MAFFKNSDHADPIDELPKQFVQRLRGDDDEQNLPGSEPAAPASPVTADAPPAAGQSPTPKDAFQASVEAEQKLQEIRSAPERVMYDAHKQYSSVFRRGTIQDTMVGEDPETVEQIDRFAAEVYSDFRLSNPEAQQVHDVFNTPVTDEVAADWRAESEAYLKSLGPTWPDQLALAKKLIARDPKVKQILSGPQGDNPILVKLIIEKAQAEKRDGRL